MNAASLATVTVTFHPDLSLLEAQLRALPADCVKMIVDNASPSELIDGIRSLAGRFPNVRMLCNDSNLGLAAAVNRGVRALAGMSPAPEFVLLLDQDSEPRHGSVAALLAAFHQLESDGQRIGSVGPLLLDPATGLTHGFHQCTRWRWKRVYPTAGSAAPVPCANLNGSGTLVRTAFFLDQGGLDESLFIDHVDTEWAFRLLAAGYTLWGVPSAVFIHRMGQASVRFWWFGWRLWPSRSPQRHYYLYRNAAVLLRRAYVPLVWKLWAVAKLAATLAVTLALDSQRLEQAVLMGRGLRDAFRTKQH